MNLAFVKPVLLLPFLRRITKWKYSKGSLPLRDADNLLYRFHALFNRGNAEPHAAQSLVADITENLQSALESFSELQAALGKINLTV